MGWRNTDNHDSQRVWNGVHRLALAHTNDGARLYAADAESTNVLVYSGKWQLDAILKDRTLPQGLTTYNVAVIGKKIYVSYAPPPGVESGVHGVIDVFNFNDQLERPNDLVIAIGADEYKHGLVALVHPTPKMN